MDLSINHPSIFLTIVIMIGLIVGCQGKSQSGETGNPRFKDDHKALVTDSIDQNPSWAGKLLLDYPLTDSPLPEFKSTQYLGFFITPACSLSYRQVNLDAFFRNEGGMRVLDLKPDSSGGGLFYIASVSDNQEVETVYPTSDALIPLCDLDNLDLDRLGLAITPGDTTSYSIGESKVQIAADDSEGYKVYVMSGDAKALLIQHRSSKGAQHQPW